MTSDYGFTYNHILFTVIFLAEPGEKRGDPDSKRIVCGDLFAIDQRLPATADFAGAERVLDAKASLSSPSTSARLARVWRPRSWESALRSPWTSEAGGGSTQSE